jgi:hypothetical protein
VPSGSIRSNNVASYTKGEEVLALERLSPPRQWIVEVPIPIWTGTTETASHPVKLFHQRLSALLSDLVVSLLVKLSPPRLSIATTQSGELLDPLSF